MRWKSELTLGVFVLLFCARLVHAAHAPEAAGPDELRVENLTNPLGLDARAPRFSWQLLGTGFLGTPYLLQELTKSGHSGVAYKLLLNTQYPSWG